jgi:hypothetical protein
MYFEVHVVAKEFRRKMLATAAPHFSGFFLYFRAQKDSNKQRQSRIGTRGHLLATTCAQSAAGRREGKAKM